MGIDRFAKSFERAKTQGVPALLPYLTAGYPDLSVTEQLIRRADAAGAVAVEIGIPFSDSIADGPVIQSSFHRVLERGQTLEDVFGMVQRVRSDVSCALVAMVSYSIVYRIGVSRFLERSVEAGLDGIILPDVPLEEADGVSSLACEKGLASIGLVAPTSPLSRRKAIAEKSTGFVYQIAVAGTTGERATLPENLASEVAQLRDVTSIPVCVGFGICDADQVRAICGMADGAIVGSAIVRRITDAIDAGADAHEIVKRVSAFVEGLAGLTND